MARQHAQIWGAGLALTRQFPVPRVALTRQSRDSAPIHRPGLNLVASVRVPSGLTTRRALGQGFSSRTKRVFNPAGDAGHDPCYNKGSRPFIGGAIMSLVTTSTVPLVIVQVTFDPTQTPPVRVETPEVTMSPGLGVLQFNLVGNASFLNDPLQWMQSETALGFAPPFMRAARLDSTTLVVTTDNRSPTGQAKSHRYLLVVFSEGKIYSTGSHDHQHPSGVWRLIRTFLPTVKNPRGNALRRTMERRTSGGRSPTPALAGPLEGQRRYHRARRRPRMDS